MAEDAIHLRKVFNLWDSVYSIICIVIGTAIFVTPQKIYFYLGSPVACICMWIAGGLVNLTITLSYLELALTFPKTGYDVVYVQEAFGNLPSFLITWIKVFFRSAALQATGALAFSTYLSKIVWASECDNPPQALIKLIAILAMSLLGFINALDTKLYIATAALSTYGKIIGLLSIIFMGIGYICLGNGGHTGFFDNTASTDLGNYVNAFILCYWAYAGCAVINQFIEEVKPPVERKIITSIFVSTAIVTTIYVLTNIALCQC